MRSFPRFLRFIPVFLMLLTVCSPLPAESLVPPERADFTGLNWTVAFRQAHQKLSKEYAFTEWKGIDWDYLYEHFFPQVELASAAGDERTFYLLLRQYVFSIPDGHMALVSEKLDVPAALAREEAGGGFGLSVAELDNTRVIAAAVVPGGQAALGGIEPGAEIITWNCLPIGTAISGVAVDSIPYRTLWTHSFADTESPQATSENHRLEQAKLLVRGPVGSKATLVFRNPDTDNLQVAILTAMEDNGATFDLLDLGERLVPSDMIDFWMLPEGYGYIRLRPRIDPGNMGAYPVHILERFREAILFFRRSAVPGLIIDIRGNYGGIDELAADLCGFFFTDEELYGSLDIFDPEKETFIRAGELAITPKDPHYDGYVVALINPGTKSSGEGIASSLSRSPKGSTLGFFGTNGSFGVTGGEIIMPGGYMIRYPFGRSLDRNEQIQIDSRLGEGGVTPDLRVPRDVENILAFAEGIDVELKYAVDHLDRLTSGDNINN
ncbi:MAG TPA: S41 family peptidase [Synergistales bacterium]|nr:S41 family peptidase [Synergistales bacterium]